jgi:uncharacterized membrane protein YphA (DoxX/SURF4 family)
MNRTYRRVAAGAQILLAATFIAIPISRMLGAPTLQQVRDLGAPEWLIWVADAVEIAGAVLLLLGLRVRAAAVAGAALLTASMIGATGLHLRAGNLFAEVPWTLVILALCLLIAAVRLGSVSKSVIAIR